MLSLIICSREPDISQVLKENIRETIGIQYELIILDNSQNKYSIFSAYNEGVERAKYSYLCFMHEDILYHTLDWGTKVVNHFMDSKAGIIGVAGGHYMPDIPASWASAKVESKNILQSSIENGEKIIQPDIELGYFKGRIAIEVTAVDGVWFCMPKKLFQLVTFDEKTFKGFHCYDLDICFQVRQKGYKVQVVSNILLEHFSGGNWNEDWLSNSIIFHKKWSHSLPQIAGVELNDEEQKVRTTFVAERFESLKELNRLKTEIKKNQSSIAYRLGKFLLKPFTMLRDYRRNL